LFQEVIRLSPQNYRGYNELAAAYTLLNRFAEAEQELRRAISVQPNYLTYRNLGYMFLSKHAYAQAVTAVDSALALNPDDWWSWRWRAHALHWRGRAEDARRSWRRVAQLTEDHLKINPRRQDVLCGYAEALIVLGDRERGLQQLSFLASLGPMDAFTSYMTAQVYEMVGNRAAALEYIHKALASAVDYSKTIATDPWLARLRSDPQYKGPR
jgi:Flp pilus assembly protein TadD